MLTVSSLGRARGPSPHRGIPVSRGGDCQGPAPVDSHVLKPPAAARPDPLRNGVSISDDGGAVTVPPRGGWESVRGKENRPACGRAVTPPLGGGPRAGREGRPVTGSGILNGALLHSTRRRWPVKRRRPAQAGKG